MLAPVYTRQFEKDVKRAKRRGKDLEKFKAIARSLIAEAGLDPLLRDHRLVGTYAGRRECHIEPDWLLIYKLDPPRLVFERMGTHADLFGR
jgi:mRNA interferase YafQ